MSFEDRLRAAADARRQNDRAAANATEAAANEVDTARKAAKAKLDEVGSAIQAVQGISTPPRRPAEPADQRLDGRPAWDEGILKGDRWAISCRYLVEKEGAIRPRWLRVFDCWHFSLSTLGAWTTVLVRPTAPAEFTYSTAESMGNSSPPMSVGAFAELGLVAWQDGMYKDSTWRAGFLRVTDHFELFLDAAAAFVVSRGSR